MFRPLLLAAAFAGLPLAAWAQTGDAPVSGHHAAPTAAPADGTAATTVSTTTATTTATPAATTTTSTTAPPPAPQAPTQHHASAHHAATHHAPAQQAAAATTGAPSAARPAFMLGPIEPQNALETVFVSAEDNAQMRPAFRQRLLDSMVVVAMTSPNEDGQPRLVPLRDNVEAVAIFTSVDRLTTVLGPGAFYVTMNGREALSRLRGQHVVINYRLIPMLTLDPDDVTHFLAIPIQPQQ